MHLPRPEPSYPIQHTSVQPCRGSWVKMCREIYFCTFVLRHPLDSLLFWLTFQLQNWGMQPQSCTQSGEDILPIFSPRVWADPQQKKGLVPSSVCCLHKQLFGKRFYIFHSRTTLIWVNLQVLRGAEKQDNFKKEIQEWKKKTKNPPVR